MKVEWLGPNDAILTRGWFRKRQAAVTRAYEGRRWQYTGTDIDVPNLLDGRLDRAARRRKRKEQYREVWVPVGQLPAARVVR